ncbi:MAG: sugar/nucleoside kinase (ribokinase family) [Candidatus Azotimanducaceae bacterium]|jgi:sugar/nucleoside kinase (ribokinase family)|tara:strand:+ start:741 stop:1730 length:990 start_codon:yes stop_codon:yes gene_type:complete
MYDIYGIGNAIVDVDVTINEDFLQAQELPKGQMTLVDSQRISALVEALGNKPMNRCSGGSAANTIFAATGFGLTTGYACRLANDVNGNYFSNEMSEAGILTSTIDHQSSESSGQCLVMITDDAQRTMCTDLGISSNVTMNEVDQPALNQANMLYIEGYLSSSPVSAASAIKCHEMAKEEGIPTALTLSDVSMVSFFRESLTSIIGNGVDVLFCNAEEALSWAQTDRLDIAINELKDIAPELYITLGSDGAQVVTKSGAKNINGLAVSPVDTNGAGDIYAGACLAARSQGASPQDAARFANHAAAHLIQLFGARLTSVQAYADLKGSFVS